LIIGLVALLTSLTLIGGLVLGVLAAILGVIARAQVRHGQASNGDVAMIGIVLGVLAILASLIIGVFWVVPQMAIINA
jgi:chromate transport protein ChrA